MHVDLRDVSVTIGIPVYGAAGIPPHTVASLVSTMHTCASNGIRCEFFIEQGLIEISRDAVLDDFLNQNDTQKLFWIDSDMVWEPGDFLRLLALSTQVDVVCAAYPRKMEGTTQFLIDIDPEFKAGPCDLFPIRATGLGFTVVSREACQKLAGTKPEVLDVLNGRSMRSVFRVDVVDGKRRSEDVAFFADLRELGYDIWLDPTINLGHVGLHEWKGNLMDYFKKGQTDRACG